MSFDFFLQNLLLLEEFEVPSTECFDQENVVEIKAADFVWDLPLDGTDNISQIKDNSKQERKLKKSSSGILYIVSYKIVSSFVCE